MINNNIDHDCQNKTKGKSQENINTFGKISNDIIFSPFKTEWNPRWDASMPGAEFPRIKEWIAGL